MGEIYRNYKINFNLNKEHEIAYIPGEFYKLHLEQSKAAIHIYHYLCLRANKKNDLGFVRNISTLIISSDLNMPLRSVQDALNRLKNINLISIRRVTFNGDRCLDIFINGYSNELCESKTYIKLPSKIFTDPFVQAEKAVISFFLQVYYLAYTKYYNSSICFSEAELLHRIKRVSEAQLKAFIDELKKLDLFEIVDLSESKLFLYKPERYYFKLNFDIAKEYASDKGVYSHV